MLGSIADIAAQESLTKHTSEVDRIVLDCLGTVHISDFTKQMTALRLIVISKRNSVS